MADIFDAYALADAWDEMFVRPGEVRTAYEPVLSALQPIEPSELRFRADQMARAFTDRGVTYAFAGEERPWPLDLVPRILDALEWDLIQRGVGQRVRALEAYLADAYGHCRAFEDGVVPWRLLLNSPTSTASPTGWNLRAASVSTSPASTSYGTKPGTSGSWRTTSASPAASRTSSRTGGP